MRDEEMPDDRLGLLDVRRAALGRRLDDDADVGRLRRRAVRAPHDAEDTRSHLPRELDRADEVDRHVVSAAPSTDGEDEDGVAGGEPRGSEPRVEARLPPLVVRPRRQLRDVVGRRVRLELAQLPEVVDGMGRVRRATPDPEDEEPAVPCPHLRERLRQRVHRGRVDGLHDLADLTQVDGCK